jgi:uncharacterized protein (TIGR00156 family)
MVSRRRFSIAILAACAASPALAQFTGPSATGATASVAQARSASIGTYLTVEGNVVAHLREDYYRFTDGMDEMTVEISPETFAGRPVGPETRVRLRGEVDLGLAGRYLYIERLDLP